MFIYLIIFCFQLNILFSKIIIPFTTIKENITPSDYASTFMYYSFCSKIETKIKIGTPSQEIALRIKTLSIPILINSIQMGTYKIIRFNESDSSSYVALHNNPYSYGQPDFTKAVKSKELINFTNNLTLYNFSFLLGTDDYYNHRESGVLGLCLADLDHRVNDVGFIKQLKERDLIQNYSFFIEYNKSSLNEMISGNIIIGSFPHEYNPNKYKKENFKEFYAEMVRGSLGLKIKEAFYGNTSINEDFKALLAIEDNFIRGTKIFKNKLIETFFGKYINNRKCTESKFSYLDNNNCEFFYCEKNINLSQFENITLIVDNFGINENDDDNLNNTHLIIELNYKELFTEFDNKYYFLMYFPDNDYESTYFKFGKIFFQKYLVNFNLETKKIGFYINNENEEEKNNEDNNKGNKEKKEENDEKILPWVLVGILVVVVFILIWFIIYINPCRKRTKRANELIDDNYTYEEGINQN